MGLVFFLAFVGPWIVLAALDGLMEARKKPY